MWPSLLLGHIPALSRLLPYSRDGRVSSPLAGGWSQLGSGAMHPAGHSGAEPAQSFPGERRWRHQPGAMPPPVSGLPAGITGEIAWPLLYTG